MSKLYIEMTDSERVLQRMIHDLEWAVAELSTSLEGINEETKEVLILRAQNQLDNLYEEIGR